MMQTEIRISSVLAPRLENKTSAKVDSILSSITTAKRIEYVPMITLSLKCKMHFTVNILPHNALKVLLFFLNKKKRSYLRIFRSGKEPECLKMTF